MKILVSNLSHAALLKRKKNLSFLKHGLHLATDLAWQPAEGSRANTPTLGKALSESKLPDFDPQNTKFNLANKEGKKSTTLEFLGLKYRKINPAGVLGGENLE